MFILNVLLIFIIHSKKKFNTVIAEKFEKQ